MPSLAMVSLPTPTDEYEFELMTRDYCEFVFGPSHLLGRRGQNQYGIDIISHSSIGIVGTQCKNYNKTPITCKSVDKMIELAESFQTNIKTFVIATTAPRDACIQIYVDKINDERNKEGKFGVSLIYWDPIIDYIKSDRNLLNKYYSGIINIQENKTSKNLQITTVEELQSEFAKYISEFEVYDFMSVDPIVGMVGYMPIEIDCFIAESRNLLNRAFVCQTEKCYTTISEFVFKIEQYWGYLVTILHPTFNDSYTIQNPYILAEINIIKDIIKEHKIGIDSVFGQIFTGVSFYR